MAQNAKGCGGCICWECGRATVRLSVKANGAMHFHCESCDDRFVIEPSVNPRLSYPQMTVQRKKEGS